MAISDWGKSVQKQTKKAKTKQIFGLLVYNLYMDGSLEHQDFKQQNYR